MNTQEETIKFFLIIGLTLGILFSFGINISETHLLIEAFEPIMTELEVSNWPLLKQSLILADLLITIGLIVFVFISRGVVGLIGISLIVLGGFLLPFSGTFTIAGVIAFFIGAILLRSS